MDVLARDVAEGDLVEAVGGEPDRGLEKDEVLRVLKGCEPQVCVQSYKQQSYRATSNILPAELPAPPPAPFLGSLRGVTYRTVADPDIDLSHSPRPQRDVTNQALVRHLERELESVRPEAL